MCEQLINHSPDLRQLIDEGYEIEIISSHLIMRSVPYVTSKKEVQRGKLVSTLNLSGDRATPPDEHQIMFSGETPCDHNGHPLDKIILSNTCQDVGGGLIVNHHFSSKPKSGRYPNYYEKMTAYAAILESEAAAIESGVTARTFHVIEANSENSPFRYIETASSRSGICALSRRLNKEIVGIVGLGGTGSYILDFIAKTHVTEIHLFDGDKFGQHNAFRAPGASTIEQLREKPLKVNYHKARYDAMRRGIHAHGSYIDESNIHLLRNMSFVFLCTDPFSSKNRAVSALEEWGIPFIDVGMGVNLIDGVLSGSLRTTFSDPKRRDAARLCIPLCSADPENLYDNNIQIAELNAMLATFAVLRWKKFRGIFADLENELTSTFNTDGNHLLNKDDAKDAE